MNAKPAVLITGASKGIGKALALEFRRRGFAVAGVSRSQPDYELDLWIDADVTSPEARARVLREYTAAFGDRLDVLINNAGRGIQETWEAMSETDLRDVFELNVFAMILLTREFLGALKNAEGTVINVSSVAGKMPVACMGAYCATKYAVNAFSDSLRIELKPHRVHVLNLIVGRISTGFGDRVLGSRHAPSTPGKGSAEKLAAHVYKAWRRKKSEIVHPGWYRLLFPLPVLLPRLYARANLKKWNLNR